MLSMIIFRSISPIFKTLAKYSSNSLLRIKTYQRNTVGQERLKDLAWLHILPHFFYLLKKVIVDSSKKMNQVEGRVSDPIFLIRITGRVDPAMSVCPYKRRDLGNYKS